MSEMKSIIFSVDDRLDLRDEIVSYVRGRLKDLDKGTMRNRTFKDGEVNVNYQESIRGRRVYLLTSPNTAVKREKLIFAIDAARRASAKEIILILPYMPYARQDKMDQPRGAIGARVLSSVWEFLGCDKVITLELHAEQIQGFFQIPVTHIKGKYLFADYVAEKAHEYGGDVVLAAADAGGGKRLEKMTELVHKRHGIDLPLVFAHKTRIEDNKVDKMRIIGEVNGKYVIFLDDMLDTGGTLCAAAGGVMDEGAIGCEGIVTHVLASGNAVESIENSDLNTLMGSNSLVIPTHDKFKQLSVAGEIGKAIIAEDYNLSHNKLQEG